MSRARKPLQLGSGALDAVLSDVRDALRSSIEQDGSDAARALIIAFDTFNAEFFDGALSKPAVLITEPSSPRAYGDHIARDDHGIPNRIRIAKRTIRKGSLFALDVLLHEMVHQWCEEVIEDSEPGYRGHGPQFAAKCNDIGEQLGLPRVAPKGKRAGMPDCAQWPINVRPAGYYPDDDETIRRARPKVGDEKPSDEPSSEPQQPDELQQLRAQVAELQELLRVACEQRNALQDERDELQAAYASADRERTEAQQLVMQWRTVAEERAAAIRDAQDAAAMNAHDAECHRRRIEAQRSRRKSPKGKAQRSAEVKRRKQRASRVQLVEASA